MSFDNYENEPPFNRKDGFLNQPGNFSSFFKERYPSIVYFVFRIVNDQEVAEDIAEEAFVVIWEKRNEIKNIKVAQAYLYSTARNASLNWLRNQKRKAVRLKAFNTITDTREGFVLESMIHAEFIRELHVALNSLPAQCRKIFHLLYLEGKSNREVAKELKLSVNTVKAQRARGLTLLRNKLSFLFFLFFLELLIFACR